MGGAFPAAKMVGGLPQADVSRDQKERSLTESDVGRSWWPLRSGCDGSGTTEGHMVRG